MEGGSVTAWWRIIEVVTKMTYLDTKINKSTSFYKINQVEVVILDQISRVSHLYICFQWNLWIFVIVMTLSLKIRFHLKASMLRYVSSWKHRSQSYFWVSIFSIWVQDIFRCVTLLSILMEDSPTHYSYSVKVLAFQLLIFIDNLLSSNKLLSIGWPFTLKQCLEIYF